VGAPLAALYKQLLDASCVWKIVRWVPVLQAYVYLNLLLPYQLPHKRLRDACVFGRGPEQARQQYPSTQQKVSMRRSTPHCRPPGCCCCWPHLVLQVTLASLVADGAVQGVVDLQQHSNSTSSQPPQLQYPIELKPQSSFSTHVMRSAAAAMQPAAASLQSTNTSCHPFG
jgi:hypothetical protein